MHSSWEGPVNAPQQKKIQKKISWNLLTQYGNWTTHPPPNSIKTILLRTAFSLTTAQSRFPVIHEVGNVGIFVFENKLDKEISLINFNSKHHYNFIFALPFVQLVRSTISKLFPFKVTQNCHRFHLCASRENLNCQVALILIKIRLPEALNWSVYSWTQLLW